MQSDVATVREQIGWNYAIEKKCIFTICKIINVLRKYNVLHQDVHLKNIVCNKSLKKFYLIDYNTSVRKSFSQMNLYEKNAFLYREDQFQLFWNFVFGRNQFPNDFRSLRKNIRFLSDSQSKMLESKLKIFFMKSYVDEVWLCFLSENPMIMKDKQSQIIFKFFLMRLFLLYHIFIDKPNSFYQELLIKVRW
jgi:hypothetical protein